MPDRQASADRGSGVLPKATAAHAIDAFAQAQFQDPIDNTVSPQKVRA